MKALFLSTILSSQMVFALGDSEREVFFHSVYSRYNAVPTPSETWGRLLSQAQINVYQVQSGDTLWDISNTLFADPQFWPKIWALNAEKIYNPHQITPGQEVLFYSGSFDLPPALGPTPKGESATLGTATKRSLPVGQIPPSFAQLKFDANPVPPPVIPPDFGMKMTREPISPLMVYLSDESLDDVTDKMVDTEIGSETASLGDVVFVELQEPIQKVYHVVNEDKLIADPKVKPTRVLGQIEVLDRASTTKSLYKAIITQNLSQIFRGSKLLPGPIPTYSTKFEGSPTSVSAKIIGGQLGNNRFMSMGQLLFLDAGVNEGVKLNDLMKIYLNPNVRNDKEISDMNFKMIGTVKVVRVAEKVSTAYVLEVNDDIRIGDWLGLQTAESNSMTDFAQSSSDGELDLGSDEELNEFDEFDELDGFDD